MLVELIPEGIAITSDRTLPGLGVVDVEEQNEERPFRRREELSPCAVDKRAQLGQKVHRIRHLGVRRLDYICLHQGAPGRSEDLLGIEMSVDNVPHRLEDVQVLLGRR